MDEERTNAVRMILLAKDIIRLRKVKCNLSAAARFKKLCGIIAQAENKTPSEAAEMAYELIADLTLPWGISSKV